jgi:hypothetical protein
MVNNLITCTTTTYTNNLFYCFILLLNNSGNIETIHELSLQVFQISYRRQEKQSQLELPEISINNLMGYIYLQNWG